MDTMPAPRFRRGKLLKIVRRVHLYAGLVMLPWLIFFGLSGILFNHPNVGEDVQGRPVPPGEVAELSGLVPWQAARAAERVVQRLNERTHQAGGRGPYSVDPSFDARFEGAAVFTAPAPEGRYMLLLNMERAGGVLVTRKARPSGAAAQFPELQLELPEYSTRELEPRVQGLLRARGLPELDPLRAHPKIAPELRLRVRDRDGALWNLTYNTGTGQLNGRRADAFPNIGVAQLFAKLHTTHHYPLRLGVTFFWALFEDLLGLTMVVWGVSGLAMWWQIKPTRRAGIVSIAVALGLALLVMIGTTRHLMFGEVKQVMGPGE